MKSNPYSDDELHLIKDKCKLDEFTQKDKTILEDIIDTLYYKDTLKVGSVTVNHYKILDKLKLIVKENLIQLLDILNNIPNIQNAKNYLTRSQANGICVHNDRKAKNHSNKEIDISKSNLNYYLKKNELSYTKEFDKLRKKYNLQGQIRSNSIIMCEMIFTSDKEFFDTIGIEETKRYFKECYKFTCNYKNLGDKNIISAVVHFDETTPHMHLIYIPVVRKKDKDRKEIDKVCCREFWEGRDSYRNLQNAFYEYITTKGFNLQRGLPEEETKRKNETIQNYKQITNFERKGTRVRI